MPPDLMIVLAEGSLLLAGGSSSDYPLPILAVGPVAGVLVYLGIYSRYRNKDKRYRYESESDVEVGNMMMRDRRVQHRTGVRGRRMEGANDHEHLDRVRRVQIRELGSGDGSAG